MITALIKLVHTNGACAVMNSSRFKSKSDELTERAWSISHGCRFYNQ